MKNNVKPTTKRVLKELKTPSAKASLKPFLSPLEQSVILHNGQPFKFKISGTFVYVSGYACMQLIQGLTQKLRLGRHLVQMETTCARIPFRLREKFDDPAVILSLYPRLRNRLWCLQCYNLFAVMQKGRAYFINEQKFSKQAMQTLDGLFAKVGCNKLFL